MKSLKSSALMETAPNGKQACICTSGGSYVQQVMVEVQLDIARDFERNRLGYVAGVLHVVQGEGSNLPSISQIHHISRKVTGLINTILGFSMIIGHIHNTHM
jgi:hypothetical protein